MMNFYSTEYDSDKKENTSTLKETKTEGMFPFQVLYRSACGFASARGSAELNLDPVSLDKSALRFRCLRLIHPDAPGDGPGLLIGDGVAGQLQRELDLTSAIGNWQLAVGQTATKSLPLMTLMTRICAD